VERQIGVACDQAPGPEASGLEGVARLSATDDIQSNLCAIRETFGRAERE
jgi:hypothetical protein